MRDLLFRVFQQASKSSGLEKLAKLPIRNCAILLACLSFLPGDQQLVQIIDASALADNGWPQRRLAGLRFRCTQCCVGAFAINQLDVLRLQQGLADPEKVTDPARAAQIRERARASIARLAPDFSR